MLGRVYSLQVLSALCTQQNNKKSREKRTKRRLKPNSNRAIFVSGLRWFKHCLCGLFLLWCFSADLVEKNVETKILLILLWHKYRLRNIRLNDYGRCGRPTASSETKFKHICQANSTENCL